MKKYPSKFLLLLRIKKLAVIQKQKQLAEDISKHNWLEQRVISLKNEIIYTEQVIFDCSDQAKQRQLHDYLAELNYTLPAIEQEVVKANKGVLVSQEQLQEKINQRKVIENIYQTRYNLWRKDLFRRNSE